MKKQDLNMDIFDNADEETIDVLAKKYIKLSDEEAKRIFHRSRQKYLNNTIKSNKSEENELIIEVKSYKSRVLKRIFAAAATLMVTAIVVTCGYNVIKYKTDLADTSFSSNVAEENKEDPKAPFGDLYNDDIRITSAAYVPYVIKVNDEERHKIADAMNQSVWKIKPDDFFGPNGEYSIVYVYNEGNPYRLEFYDLDNTIVYKSQDVTVMYEGDETAMKCISEFLKSDYAPENLVWYEFEKLTDEGIWDNKFTVPDDELKMFETAKVPEELQGKEIRGYYAEVDYACDNSDIDFITGYSDAIITGYVKNIEFSTYDETFGYNQKSPVTVITVETSEGEIDLIMYGGYISMRDHLGDMLGMTGGKFGEGSQLTDEEIDNIYYYHAPFPYAGRSDEENRLLPVCGEYYAFFVKEDEGKFYITCDLCGILHQNGDDFVQMVSEGEYRHFSLADLIRRTNENNYS